MESEYYCNDTAENLRIEYSAAFYKFDVDEALKRIDNYIRTEMFDESGEEKWCNYIYAHSLYVVIKKT